MSPILFSTRTFALTTLSSTLTLILLLLATITSAHEHHGENVPEGQTTTSEPIDAILWTHILLQGLAWGILYPLGMVLGLVRSRWHVPVQILASAIAVVGYFLGHAHKGRQFTKNIHATFATPLVLMAITQVVLGVYLRLHLERGLFGKSRGFFVRIHKIMGIAIPIASWVQMLFGGIVLEGFCHDDHMGQCLAHFIMGSAFIGYGIVLMIMLLVGQTWLRRRGKSQEFFDSALIAAWGCVNTFTEHHWGGPWVHNDLQHTSMGIVWWAAGLMGMWLSYDSKGRPKRNLIPGLVIFLTGWAMSGHPQHLPLSTMIHSVFGYTLMAAGLSRIIEIVFILRDKQSYGEAQAESRGEEHYENDAPEHESNSFQYLPPFLLIAGGFQFMAATEEQMALMAEFGMTHVAYVLILFSVAFVLFLFVNILIRIYSVSAKPSKPLKLSSQDSESGHRLNGRALNGHALNGSARHGDLTERERRQLQQAEDFELDGLISDDEDARMIKDGDLDSSSGSSGTGRRKEARI